MKNYKWLDSVYSDTTKNFVSNPYPKKGEKITIYLRVLKNDDLKHVFLRSREYGVEFLYEMQPDFVQQNLVYYKVEVAIKDPYFNYQFYLVLDDKTFYYTQYRITDYIPSEEKDFVILADYKAPCWVKDSVFYQIFPDRFCNGDPSLNVKTGEYSYQGFSTTEEEWDSVPKEFEQGHNLDFHNGDLYGIIKKLDYLQDLGINAIYLNPIFLSPSTHKYDALDYFKIDPHLGGEKAFSELISELHKRGMKLMLDISVNHTSNNSVWFKEAYENKNSPYRDFYFFNEDNSYATWFGVKTMPQLNYGSKSLRDIIYKNKDSVLKKWMLPPFGIDGWRFDVADCLARNEILDVHDEVLSEIRTELKSVNSEAYLLAEEWADCSTDLKGNRWDATMNYFGVGRALREFAGAKDLYNERNETLEKVKSRLTADQLANRVMQFLAVVPGAIQLQQFNLLDSHDVVRLHRIKTVSVNSLKMVLALQFTLPGTPCIYYGDEIYLEGTDNRKEDCGFRYPFDWNWQKNDFSVKMRDYYKKLIALRKTEEALKDGSFAVVYAKDYLLVTARFTKDSVIFTAVSQEEDAKEVDLKLENFGLSLSALNLPAADFAGAPLDFKADEKTNHLALKILPNQTYIFKLNAGESK